MSRLGAILFVLLALMLGCAATEPKARAAGELPADAFDPDGIVFILGGVANGVVGARWLESDLAKSGCLSAVHVYDWSGGVTSVYEDVTDVEANRERARKLARMIEEYHEACPGGMIQMVGMSGGSAIVVWALEDLPVNVRVRRALLMAPALSPRYDLTRALRHVDKDLIVFVSENDRLVLGAGTSTLGTLDGVKTDAAGRVGFSLPANAGVETRSLYHKMKRVDWSADMILEGNYGGHLGWFSPWYLRHRVVPMLVGERTDFGF